MKVIELNQVVVDLPVYNVDARSLRKNLVRLTTGGRLMQDSSAHVVVRALDRISLTAEEGDRIALVGHNGAGKSTLLRTIGGVYAPTAGRVEVRGNVSTVLDPSTGIDPEASGEENIRLLARYRNVRKADAEAAVEEIADFTELGQFLKLPVKTYSSGMLARLVFAVATSFQPDILVMDEWLGAGDAAFVQKAQDRMVEFVSRARVLVLASHSSDIVERFCNRAILLDAGRVKAMGSPTEILPLLSAGLQPAAG